MSMLFYLPQSSLCRLFVGRFFFFFTAPHPTIQPTAPGFNVESLPATMSIVFPSALALLPLPTISAQRPVRISVDASTSLGPLTVINRFFGCDEPNFAYYPDGQKLLSELGNLGPAQTYFRTHSLLTTGNRSTVGVPALKWGSTSAYTENAEGNPVYNWTIVDRIFDAYLSANVKPYVQVGFMPLALSTHPDPYFFTFTATSPYDAIYTGWSSTPTSYERWEELVYQWTKHSVEKYGQAEVESWYWEVWSASTPSVRCR